MNNMKGDVILLFLTGNDLTIELQLLLELYEDVVRLSLGNTRNVEKKQEAEQAFCSPASKGGLSKHMSWQQISVMMFVMNIYDYIFPVSPGYMM